MKNVLKKYRELANSRVFTIVSIAFVIIMASFIFYLRYTPNFTHPNFYGEDGPVYTSMVMEKGYVKALFTPFNGYLIVGLYLVMYLGHLSNALLGGGLFSHLPFHYALASCLFMGAVFSLPYILFRKELGKLASLTIVILSVFVPLKMRDYAVIGTIGNIKFIFVYLAFLLILYRVLYMRERKLFQIFILDFILLISVLTNGSVVLLLPFAFYPYIAETIKQFKKSRQKNLKKKLMKNFQVLIKDPTFISLFALTVISFLYAAIIQVKGVPRLEFLEIPYNNIATAKIINRVTFFALTFPFTSTLDDKISIGLVIMLLVMLFIYKRKEWFVWTFGGFAIAASVILFLHNRPGVWIWYGSYLHMGGTDEFFYFANLIFYFVVFWVLRDRIKKLSTVGICLFVFGLGLFLVWSQPYGMSSEKLKQGYAEIGTLMQNLDRECSSDKDQLEVNVYPTSDWHMQVSRKIACVDYATRQEQIK